MGIPVDSFALQVPTTSLGDNPTTLFTSISASNLRTINQGAITAISTYVPTTTLGYNPNNPFTSISSSQLVVTGSGGYMPIWGARVPSIPLGGQFSTYIYTSNAPITSIGGTTSTPTQTWYMS